MSRNWIFVAVATVALGAFTASTAFGDDPLKSRPQPPAPAPAEKKAFKRVIHSIELATSKKEKFSGSVTLRIASGHAGRDLKYHWGGKCKGTKVSSARLGLMMRAMEKGLAVEIPAQAASVQRSDLHVHAERAHDQPVKLRPPTARDGGRGDGARGQRARGRRQARQAATGAQAHSCRRGLAGGAR